MRNLFITLTMSFLLAFNPVSVFAEESEIDWIHNLGLANVKMLESKLYTRESVQEYSDEIRSDLKALGVSKNGLDRYMADFNLKYLDDLKY